MWEKLRSNRKKKENIFKMKTTAKQVNFERHSNGKKIAALLSSINNAFVEDTKDLEQNNLYRLLLFSFSRFTTYHKAFI